MNPFLYSEEAGAKGLPPLSPAPPIPAESASASLRTISLDDSEHLLHNHHASVASLRLLFTFAPERRSASLRNRCSPSPEYPVLRTGRRCQSEEESYENKGGSDCCCGVYADVGYSWILSGHVYTKHRRGHSGGARLCCGARGR